MATTAKKRTEAPQAPARVETAASPEAKRKPVATVRAGDCSASVWARERVVQGAPRTFYSVTLERSYKDRDGSWKYTRSFDAESLGAVVGLCQQASEAIAGLQQQEAVK